MPNSEHAKRLRDAATMTQNGNLYLALLAGANALEVVDVAKAALETIRDRCRSAGQGAAYGELKDIREYVPDDMRQCDDVATAALARLEGK